MGKMAFVTRYHITDDQGRMWNGEDFSWDRDMADEYRELDEAEEDAAKLGGFVEEFTRANRFGDLPRLANQFQIAAE
jgi:hypothetical protein